MEPIDIDVQLYRPQIEGLVRKFGPSGCQVLVVDSVQEWAKSVGIEEEDPFRAAMAATNRSDGAPVIVLLRCITGDIQGSIVGALLFHGFLSEVERLKDPAAFLEHLVLHELAHLVLGELASESDCDRWAFERLGNLLRVSV